MTGGQLVAAARAGRAAGRARRELVNGAGERLAALPRHRLPEGRVARHRGEARVLVGPERLEAFDREPRAADREVAPQAPVAAERHAVVGLFCRDIH